MLPAYRLLTRAPNVAFSGNFTGANEDYARWIGMAPERIHLIPNVIEPERLATTAEQRDAIRTELGLEPDDKLVLGVFRLAPEKDPLLFLDVCGRLCAAREDVICAIAGAGELDDALAAKIEEAGLSARIRLLGRRQDVAALMSSATVLLQTSLHEGMPNAVMEAQTLGVPVVATAAGGTGAVVADGETGILASVGDAEALTAGCLALVSDPVKAAAMGEAGRRRMLAMPGEDQLAGLYLDAVQGVRRPASVTTSRANEPA
jgi:glycosyltransferase involved in cell wall biosynthesis